MKRLAMLLVAVAAIALPSGAGAATTQFSGKFENGGRVSFGLDGKNGTYTAVVGWSWENFKIHCRNGRHRQDGNFKEPIPITDMTFVAEKINRYGGTAKVKGTFSEDWKSASGIFKVSGPTSWGNHCHSGKIAWHATAEPAM